MDPVLRHQQRHFLFIGIGKNIALVQAALDIVALGLLGEDHGDTISLGADRGQSDTAGLGGQHHRDILYIKILGKFVRNSAHQSRIHPVIEKTVHLDDVPGENTPLPLDAILQLLHDHHFLSKSISTILPDFSGKSNREKCRISRCFLPIFVGFTGGKAGLISSISSA